MDPALVEIVKGVVAFLLPAATGLTAYWMWLRARAQAGAGRDRLVTALREENDQLRAEVDSRMAEFEERVHFVERRLVQERDRPGIAPQVPTPV